MKYYEMHDEVYEKLSEEGKISWDGLTSAEDLFDHEINIALAKKIDHYFPIKNGKKVIDLGCGTGTAALYLAKLGFDVEGYDVSSKAIEIADKNKQTLNLSAKFEVKDLNSLEKVQADLTVDSSLLHCLVDEDHRKHFFDLCSDLTFIHTMIESSDMTDMLDRDYLELKDGVLWSTGPERWKMDWHYINGRPMFKHRRICRIQEFLAEVEENGFEVLEYYLSPNEKNPDTFIGWIRRK